MTARRTRRMSSSLLPLNITPAMTSTQPPPWWKGPLGPLTTGRDHVADHRRGWGAARDQTVVHGHRDPHDHRDRHDPHDRTDDPDRHDHHDHHDRSSGPAERPDPGLHRALVLAGDRLQAPWVVLAGLDS